MSSIYEKIEQKGQNEINEIFRFGEEKAKALEKQMLSDANNEIEKNTALNMQINANLVLTKVTEIEQILKQQTLAKKKDLIDRVINNVNLKMNNITDEELIKITIKMLLSEKLNGDEIIKVSKSDYTRYLKLFYSGKTAEDNCVLDKLNVYLKNDKLQMKLTKTTANINGGFIVIGKNYDIDNSFKTILNEVKNKYEAEIANVLFSE